MTQTTSQTALQMLQANVTARAANGWNSTGSNTGSSASGFSSALEQASNSPQRDSARSNSTTSASRSESRTSNTQGSRNSTDRNTTTDASNRNNDSTSQATDATADQNAAGVQNGKAQTASAKVDKTSSSNADKAGGNAAKAASDDTAANDVAGLPAAIAALLAQNTPSVAAQAGTPQASTPVSQNLAAAISQLQGRNNEAMPTDTPVDASLLSLSTDDASADSSLEGDAALDLGDGKPGTKALTGEGDATPLRATNEGAGGSFAAALHNATDAIRAPSGDGNTVAAANAHAAAQRLADNTAASTPRMTLQTPLGHAGWSEEIGSKVNLMLGKNESKAELTLTPSNLGKLEISIHMDGDQTTATFVASTQAARDALEESLPRLREVLQQAGINLAQSDVSTFNQQQAGQDDSQQGRGGSGRYRGGSDDGSLETLAASSAALQRSARGLVDTFA